MSLIVGPDGWSLAPGGALIHVHEKTAVIADVHLGYEWSRGAGGDVVPAHSLNETVESLARLLRLAVIDRLIVAGDLVESPRPCRRTEADLNSLVRWLGSQGVRLSVVPGNHDSKVIRQAPPTIDVAGWTIAHGHEPILAPRTITGHEHPILRLGRTSAPCILVAPSAIILPAFTKNAAGLNVAESPKRWHGRSFHCWASTGTQLMNFGPIDDLAERVAAC